MHWLVSVPRTHLSRMWVLNPILTGGGGCQFDPPPPVRNPQLPRDRRRLRHAFSWVFSFKFYASFDTKFGKIGPSVARSRDILYSHEIWRGGGQIDPPVKTCSQKAQLK